MCIFGCNRDVVLDLQKMVPMNESFVSTRASTSFFMTRARRRGFWNCVMEKVRIRQLGRGGTK